MRARKPIGILRAVSDQDPSSLERDGQKFWEMNAIATRDGRPLAEVCFGDGMWLLVDPSQDDELI